MPIEHLRLRDRKPALEKCPHCNWPEPDFLRGQVQSWWRRKFGLAYCAIICQNCKRFIGWEKP